MYIYIYIYIYILQQEEIGRETSSGVTHHLVRILKLTNVDKILHEVLKKHFPRLVITKTTSFLTKIMLQSLIAAYQIWKILSVTTMPAY